MAGEDVADAGWLEAVTEAEGIAKCGGIDELLQHVLRMLNQEG